MKVVVVLVVLVAAATGHQWSTGRCPTPTPFNNFDVNRFLGVWYVIQQTDTTSNCLTMNYTRASPTQLRITKSRQLLILDTLSVEHLNTYSANLDIPNFDRAAAMRVKWALNVAGKADYTVVDTDYDNYAVIFECQQLTSLFHRHSAAILSRSPVLLSDLLLQARSLLVGERVDTGDLDNIDHNVCIRREDANLNIDIDEDTIKRLLRDATSTARDFASQLVGGAENLAATLANVGRTLAATGNSQDIVIVDAEQLK